MVNKGHTSCNFTAKKTHFLQTFISQQDGIPATTAVRIRTIP
jgi:hypothetical protein